MSIDSRRGMGIIGSPAKVAEFCLKGQNLTCAKTNLIFREQIGPRCEISAHLGRKRVKHSVARSALKEKKMKYQSNDIVEKEIKEFFRNKASQFQKEIDQFLQLLNICESPIEKLALINLADQFGSEPMILASENSPSPHLFCRLNIWKAERFIVRIFPQYHIKTDNGNYRIDFLLTMERDEFDKDSFNEITHLKIAIEIDGHDFHEKTKEQAIKDKTRDRGLQKAGYKVFHYTGSEIYNESDEKLYEIFEYVSKKAYLIVDSLGM